jgi:phage terminase small subunit
MPVLRNERHERFAQGIAKGKNGADAYLAAGYALARDAAARNAYRLRSRQDIKARIDDLAGEKCGRVAVEQVVERRPKPADRPSIVPNSSKWQGASHYSVSTKQRLLPVRRI